MVRTATVGSFPGLMLWALGHFVLLVGQPAACSPSELYCPWPDSLVSNGSYLLQKAKQEMVIWKTVFVNFPHNTDLRMNDAMRTHLWADFEVFLTRQSRGTHNVLFEVVYQPDDTNHQYLWTASRNSAFYGNASEVLANPLYQDCWSTCASTYQHCAELQAEILTQIETAYSGLPSPFQGADFIAFIYAVGNGGNPIAPDVGGLGGLQVRKAAFSVLDDVAFASDCPSESCDADQCQPRGIINNVWNFGDYKWELATILAHEYGHQLGLGHHFDSGPAPPACDQSSAGSSCYFGPYSLMRTHLLGGRPFQPFHEDHLHQLGWIPDQQYVTVAENLRDVAIFDIRQGGSLFRIPFAERGFVLPLDPPIIMHFSQVFTIAFHAQTNEDALPAFDQTPMYKSRGLAIWHHVDQTVEGNDDVFRLWMDLESAWGLYYDAGSFGDPDCWLQPDPQLGLDNLDAWLDRQANCIMRNSAEHRQYAGSQLDFISLIEGAPYPGEFSFRTNPNTYGYEWAETEYFWNFGRYAPQNIENSIMIRVKEDRGDHLVVDILLAPYQDVISPNGGEAFTVNQVAPITWSVDATLDIDRVDIEFSADGGASWSQIAQNEANDGHCQWTPGPQHVTNNGKIRLIFHNTHSSHTGDDESDAAFTIWPVQYVDRSDNAGPGIENPGTPYSVVTLDYNRDKKLEVLITKQDASGTILGYNDVTNGVPYFHDWTSLAFALGEAPPPGSRGIAVSDYNNDGWRDIFIAHATQPRLYAYRTTDGKLHDMSAATGLGGGTPLADCSWAGAWADYDRDGDVDLFVARADGQATPEQIQPLPDRLLRNDVDPLGSGVRFFTEVALPGSHATASVTAAWADVEKDGDMDLFVGDLRDCGTWPCSRFYINQGDGTFSEEAGTRFQAGSLDRCTAVEWVDVNRDVRLDLAVANKSSGGWVFQNDGQGYFGAPAVTLDIGGPATGVRSLDADRDGRRDLLLLSETTTASPRLYANVPAASGWLLRDVTGAAGLDVFAGRTDGAAVADFDGDTFADLYLGRERMNSRKPVYLKGVPITGPGPSAWVGLRLVGYANNAASTGARVHFTAESFQEIQEVDGGSGRGGQRDLTLYCELGQATGPVQAEITWPSGFVRTVSVPRDSVLVVCDEGSEPQIPLGSVTASHQPKPGGLTDWIFTWETSYRSDADQDLVTITDAPGSPGQCLLGQTVELRPGDPGVVATLTAKAGGGYEHKVIWQDRLCVPNCTYDYKVASATACAASAPMSGWKQLRVRVCAQ